MIGARPITNVYIDAFNLFYGCLRKGPHKWLDLAALCQILLPSNDIKRVRYFTALVSARADDPGKPQRQQAYLRALSTIPNLEIHYGSYQSRKVRMYLAQTPKKGSKTVEVIRTDEKGSDVNLATYLVVDAFRKDCEVAVVISNDSDLAQPVRIVKDELGIKVGVVNPHPAKFRSRSLECTFFKQLSASALPRAQFPATLTDAKGTIHKPSDW